MICKNVASFSIIMIKHKPEAYVTKLKESRIEVKIKRKVFRQRSFFLSFFNRHSSIYYVWFPPSFLFLSDSKDRDCSDGRKKGKRGTGRDRGKPMKGSIKLIGNYILRRRSIFSADAYK